MTPNRRSEGDRRDEAQRLAEGLVEEAVREVPPSDMKQMLSYGSATDPQPAEYRKRTRHISRRVTQRCRCRHCEYGDGSTARELPHGSAGGTPRHDVFGQ